MKVRLEFIIPEHYLNVYISEQIFIDATYEEILYSFYDSDFNLKTNQLVTVEKEKRYFTIKDHFFPINLIECIFIRIIKDDDSFDRYIR